ncbi:hypothetical protein [Methanothrix soehngenii]
MIFTRKIQRSDLHNYGLLTMPKAILDTWPDVDRVDMLFDEAHRTIVITPRK